MTNSSSGFDTSDSNKSNYEDSSCDDSSFDDFEVDTYEIAQIPADAVLVDPPLPATASDRELAIAALRQQLAERNLALPLGPEIDPADPDRLLAVNHRVVQLLCPHLLAEEVTVPLSFWRSAATAPQLLLMAAVDDENGWVRLAGALTASEFVALAPQGTPCDEGITLPVAAFTGGLNRFLVLVRLMEAEALPRLAYPTADLGSRLTERAVGVWAWLNGQLDDSLSALGGTLVQRTAVAVRSSVRALPPASPAGVTHTMALRNDQLLWAVEDPGAPERLQLMIALAGSRPGNDGLCLRLCSEDPGVPLPDGLCLLVRQGACEHRLVSADALALALTLPPGREPVRVSVAFQGGAPLTLPPLSLLPPAPETTPLP